MQRASKKPTSKGIILRTVLIFLISYFFFLILWIQVKDNYGYAVTYIASKLMTLIKDVRFEEMRKEKPMILATFSPVGQMTNLLIDIPVKTSSYTFNAPLTFGIMAALFPFIKRRGRAYAEALLILFGVHLLYVFSLEANSLTTVFIDKGLDVVSEPRLFAYQFLWEFTNNMVIRFEPFLIGFYMFIRFRR
jgi:hypothetical protein